MEARALHVCLRHQKIGSPRTAPQRAATILSIPAWLLALADSQSVTSLLNRAGFALSTVDVDEIQIAYPSIYELIDDLKWMGEGNAVVNRRKTLNPETLFAAGEIYKGTLSPKGQLSP